jgi:hypothetical protein
MEPEAENLNFAVSTEALLHESDWDLEGSATSRNAFTSFIHQAKVRRAPAGSAPSP